MSIKGYKDENGNIQKYDIDALYTSFTSDVGQVLSVDEIDADGKPIKWKTVEQSSGEGVDITIDEDGYLVCDGEGNDGEGGNIDLTEIEADIDSLQEDVSKLSEEISDLNIPTDEHINSLISDALGVVENGSY